jgi:hypothetical protein
MSVKTLIWPLRTSHFLFFGLLSQAKPRAAGKSQRGARVSRRGRHTDRAAQAGHRDGTLRERGQVAHDHVRDALVLDRCGQVRTLARKAAGTQAAEGSTGIWTLASAGTAKDLCGAAFDAVIRSGRQVTAEGLEVLIGQQLILGGVREVSDGVMV